MMSNEFLSAHPNHKGSQNGRHWYPANGSKENTMPNLLPSTLSSMLKTTTETGELELFSIKPRVIRPPGSRTHSLRQHTIEYLDNAPLRTEQEHRYPKSVSGVDDRKFLPSYARDATSEIVSMYETASQKANGTYHYEDQGTRTYSLAQTFRSSAAISNHRSFTSLRSQPEFSLPQRPRSPYPYPSRLKRPGFRPSSPALTDAGGVDYTRRAEIERQPASSIYNTSSPSSFYARKRFPPSLSVRSEATRSNLSLLSSSPPRRPKLSQRLYTNESPQDWKNRPEHGPTNGSPARSTHSLPSTVNLYRSNPLTSVTPTPVRQPSSSPRYYDYTEAFEVEQSPQNYDSGDLSPPPFLIERTIPEDKEMSSQRSSTSISFAFSQGFPSRSLVPLTIPADEGLPTDNDCEVDADDSSAGQMVQDTVSLYTTRQQSSEELEAVDLRNHAAFSYKVKQSGPGGHCPRREVRTNHQQTSSQGVSCEPTTIHASTHQPNSNVTRPYHDETVVLETISNHSSVFSLDSHLPMFPKPPDRLVRIRSDPSTIARSQRGLIMRSEEAHQVEDEQDLYRRQTDESIVPNGELYPNNTYQVELRKPDCAGIKSIRSSRFFSVDHGLKDLAELVANFEDANRYVSEDLAPRPLDRLMKALPDIPEKSVLWARQPLGDALNKYGSDSALTISSGMERNGVLVSHRGDRQLVHDNEEGWKSRMRIDRHQFPLQSISRSDTIILSPEPISPARDLGVKRSIPELMKALPHLPHIASHNSMLNTMPPIVDNALMSENGIKRGSSGDGSTATSPTLIEPGLGTSESSTLPIKYALTCQTSDIIESMSRPRPLSKFKLKSQSSMIQSPRNSRPWNSDESYPWTGKQSLLLSSTLGNTKPSGTHPPKFKLKTRTVSNSSLGTVRVNTHAKGQFGLDNTELIYPKDLFSTVNGSLTNVFRHVSSHFDLEKTRKTGPDQRNSGTSDLEDPIRYTKNPSLKTPDVRSFFSDDSSQVIGRNSLRNRISHIRTRIPVPYNDRITSQSSNDALSRQRIEGHRVRLLPLRRSRLNLNILRDGEPGTRIDEVRQKLRTKMSGWLKGAKSVVARVVNSKSNDI